MKALCALAVTLLAGCGHVAGGFDFKEPGCKPFPASDAQKVAVHYLGSGGVAIRWRGDAILIGPSFSNPGYFRAGLWRPKAEVARIKAALNTVGIDDVRAIFAGHSHYDHIGDLPEVGKIVKDVPVYVNASGANILAVDLKGRLHELQPGREEKVGTTMRLRPIVSDHAPQLCKWNLGVCRYGGKPVEQPWTTPAAKHLLRHQGGGQTLAFDIALLDERGETAYRIYYNDAAARTPFGQTEGPFDLAILTIAQWNWVRDYPRDLVATIRPRHVLVSHWDNFFRRDDKQWVFVPWLWSGGVERFIEIADPYIAHDAGPTNDVCGVKKPQWTMVVPGSALLFKPRVNDATNAGGGGDGVRGGNGERGQGHVRR